VPCGAGVRRASDGRHLTPQAVVAGVSDEVRDGDGSAPAGGAAGVDRPDRVTGHDTGGAGNSMATWWWTARNPLRVAVHYVVIWVVRVSPSLALKRWLLRRLGAEVGPGVAFGLEATPDVFWPDRITVREDAIVGYDATLLCHEFLQDEYRLGDVVVGERAMVGAGAVVLPGVEIGADAQVAANSLVSRDVPPGATVAGVPAVEMSGDAAGEQTAGEDADPAAGGDGPDDARGSAAGEG
jgi:acetyltransferase-like isoleucine patch superfamily enzyme